MAKILVGCEYSGTVRDAFTAKGHDAMSCDLLPTESNGKHYQGDVFDLLDQKWDLIIAHPPCTALAVSGNAHYGEGQPKYQERLDSIEWTKKLWEACKKVAPKVCFENPVGVLKRLGGFPAPQYIQPWMFGHPESKKTGLFLHNLPPLKPTNIVKDQYDALPKKLQQRIHYMSPSPDRWKERSKFYTGFAEAMSSQWSEFI